MHLDAWWVYLLWGYGGFVLGWVFCAILSSNKRRRSIGDEAEAWLRSRSE